MHVKKLLGYTYTGKKNVDEIDFYLKSDFIGKTYGFLKVDKVVGVSSRMIILGCTCKCGRKIAVEPTLLGMRKKDCGCRSPAKIDEIYYAHYQIHRRGSKGRFLKFELTFEQFKDIVTRPCHYCGKVELKFTANERGYIGTGIDRKDSSLGYVMGNCLPCCIVCNRAKMDMDYDEYIEHLDNLIKYRTSVLG